MKNAVASDAVAIQEAIATRIAAHLGLSVHEVVVAPLASLPRTSSGKPQRRKTREMYLDGTMPRARVANETSQVCRESDTPAA